MQLLHVIKVNMKARSKSNNFVFKIQKFKMNKQISLLLTSKLKNALFLRSYTQILLYL